MSVGNLGALGIWPIQQTAIIAMRNTVSQMVGLLEQDDSGRLLACSFCHLVSSRA